MDLDPEAFLSRLEPYERVLLDMKNMLYEGSWERVLADLRARLKGEPYVYKLSQTIARDIAAIERIRAYELRHGIDLSRVKRAS
ncbi:MAG: hypothetical protein KIS92_19810 [Planctomycetota bacterium]|nr:hypothetical protein [Planctomycetota bacterium]